MVCTIVSAPVFAEEENADTASARARQMEYLTRGAVGAMLTTGGVYLSWRLLGTEPMNTVFNIYKDGALLAENVAATNYTDGKGTASAVYEIAPVIDGIEGRKSGAVVILEGRLDGGSYGQIPYAYFDIPLDIPPAGSSYTYSPNDASVGDVDGDGEYEMILKWDPSNSKDNSQTGVTGNVYIDCYKFSPAGASEKLWRIDLGRNIRAGAHYTQFQVYDYDGDGKAEVAMRTAPGSVDGAGKYVTDAGNTDAIKSADNSKTYVASSGHVTGGAEYLTIFNGQTGAAMQTIDYEPGRDPANGWGKNETTNRVYRFLAGTAYLDGVHPSLIMCRGYYGRSVVVAYDWDGKNLKKKWKLDSGTSSSNAFYGQGNHQLSVADLDNDGYDEIVYGSAAIDHDGTLAHSKGWGHGDALHVSDFDNDGSQEIFSVLEDSPNWGSGYREGDGTTIYHNKASSDTGRGTMDVFSEKYGAISWDSSNGIRTLDNQVLVKGGTVMDNGRNANFAIYWDGDLLREHLDGTKMSKWDDNSLSFGRLWNIDAKNSVSSNNTTKQNPCLQADLFGDWREEIVLRLADNSALRVFTSLAPTDYKFTTFMHDSQYRCAVAWQNTAYNQPPHLSYYIGPGKDMSEYTQPDIYYASVPVDVAFEVTDAGGQPVDGAEVTVGAVSGVTDANGGAKLLLNEGRHEYTVRKSGYQTVTNTVDIKGEDNMPSVAVTLEARTQTKLKVSFADENGNELKAAEDLGAVSYEPNKTYTLEDSYKEDITVGDAVYEYSADKSDDTAFILEDDRTIKLVFRKRTEVGAGDKFFYHTNLSSNGFSQSSVNHGYTLKDTSAAGSGETAAGVKYANYGIGTGSVVMPISGKMTDGTIEFNMLYGGVQTGVIGGSVYGLTLMSGDTAGNTIGLRYTSSLGAQYAVLNAANGGASYGTAAEMNKMLHYAVKIGGGRMSVAITDKESGETLKEFTDIELQNGVGSTRKIDKLVFNCGYYNPAYAQDAGSVTLGLADVRAYQKLFEFKEVYNSSNDASGGFFKYDGDGGASLAFADGVWTFTQDSTSGGREFYANLDPAAENKAELNFTFNTGGTKDGSGNWDWSGRAYSYEIQILDSEYKPGGSANVVLGLYQQYKESGVQEAQYYSAVKSKTNVKSAAAFGSPNLTARSSTTWDLSVSIDLDAQTAEIVMRGTGTGSGVTPNDGYTIANIPISASGVGAVRIVSAASGKASWTPKVSNVSYSKMVYPEIKKGISCEIVQSSVENGVMSIRALLTNNNEQSETFTAVCAAKSFGELTDADVYDEISLGAGEAQEYNFSVNVGNGSEPQIDFYFWNGINSMVPIE